MGGLFAVFVRYLKKKFNTTETGDRNDPHPLVFNTVNLREGGKNGGWHHGRIMTVEQIL